MFSWYCRACKEFYNGCFGSEVDKHKDCIQPPIPEKIKLNKPLIINTIQTNIPQEVLDKFYNTDIKKILSETSLKDELAKDS